MSIGFPCKVCEKTRPDNAYGRTKKGARKLTCMDCESDQQNRKRKKKCGNCGKKTKGLTFFKGREVCDECLLLTDLGGDLMDYPYVVPEHSGVDNDLYTGDGK